MTSPAGPLSAKHLGEEEPGTRPGSLQETVMSINTSADQRLSSCPRPRNLIRLAHAGLHASATAREVPDGGHNDDDQQDDPPVVHDPATSRSCITGRRSGGSGGRGLRPRRRYSQKDKADQCRDSAHDCVSGSGGRILAVQSIAKLASPVNAASQGGCLCEPVGIPASEVWAHSYTLCR
jgi:hypothetical protein